MEDMKDYCGVCSKHTHVKPTLVDESYEDYVCASCRRDLATVTTVKVLRIDYSDL